MRCSTSPERTSPSVGVRHTSAETARRQRDHGDERTRVDLVLDGDRDRWPLAGDQLYVDLDLRAENLPPGTRLQVGSATLEVTRRAAHGLREVHGADSAPDATRFINAQARTASCRLRGMNTRVVTPGTVRPGDTIRKL